MPLPRKEVLMTDLPIFPWLDRICAALLTSPSRFLVLTAETAAGKSTAVPIALLPHVNGKIVMLEPRRLATVAIANRIASLLGEKVGETAGYRLHLDSRVSDKTRIEIITEAILTRRIQGDPSLEGISVVILDEFHERSVHGDLALTLLKEIVSLRDDLFVIVMSATINTERIASYLDAPVLNVPGRQFPVDITYASEPDRRSSYPASIEEKTARVILRCLGESGGNILVFLPGIGEIRRTKEMLSSCDAEVLVLHSSVSFEEQQKVLDENQKPRRIILSSSIAETSLTIPGVTIVIDSGLSRIGRFNIPTGMDRLVTETESVFSATQRAGRAGRTAPGRCIRLWNEHDLRLQDTPPEITRTDVLPLVLECALWGVSDPDKLDWLDPPNKGAWTTASELLSILGAIEANGHITQKGRYMTSLGVHPRIAAVALAGETGLAARYAQFSDNPNECERLRLDLERRIKSLRIVQKNPVRGLMALLEGFPDRIGRHTHDGIYQFPSGRLASLPKNVRESMSCPPQWIIALEVDSGDREGRIYKFENLVEKEVEPWLFDHSIKKTDTLFSGGDYTPGGKLIKTEYCLYGKIVLSERRINPEARDIPVAVCSAIRSSGLSVLPWSSESESFFNRARFALRKDALSKKGEADDLLESLETWLVPFLPADGKITEELLFEALKYRFGQQSVDKNAPPRITLQNGLSKALIYEELAPGEGPCPVLEIKIQELFGCAETPRVDGEGVLLRLLSPARRPVQITRDLAGFWKNTWNEVRKELKGRYPKHKWPENPFMN